MPMTNCGHKFVEHSDKNSVDKGMLDDCGYNCINKSFSVYLICDKYNNQSHQIILFVLTYLFTWVFYNYMSPTVQAQDTFLCFTARS